MRGGRMATRTPTPTAVPIGYRFLPTDEELIVDYLSNKVAGKLVPSTAVVEADVYGTEPWNLLRNGEQEAYFFAVRKRKNAVGMRVDRRAGTGTWTLCSKKEESVTILDVDGREIAVGCKSNLSFNDGKNKNSGWIMHEYELSSTGGVFQTQVICHIKNRAAGKIKKRWRSQEVGNESALTAMQTPHESASGECVISMTVTATPPPPAKRACNGLPTSQRALFLEPAADAAAASSSSSSTISTSCDCFVDQQAFSDQGALSPSSTDCVVDQKAFCDEILALASLVEFVEEENGNFTTLQFEEENGNFTPWLQLQASEPLDLGSCSDLDQIMFSDYYY